jgi:hypothetical protein
MRGSDTELVAQLDTAINAVRQALGHIGTGEDKQTLLLSLDALLAARARLILDW